MPKKQAPSDVSYHKDLLGLKKRPALLESLFLDPKNPRFKTPASIAESRYEEQPVQERALAELKSIGIDDLLASIRSYGFVPSDPLVVRPLGEKKHVVVEGNRRVATLKTLMKGHQDGTSPLPEYIVKSITQLEVLVYDGDDPNIAWILQGLRHMTGIKEWQPLQQAEFLAKVEAELRGQKGKKLRPPPIPTLAPYAALPVAKASRLLNAYYALEQALEDEDYGDASDLRDSFAIFTEGVFRKTSLYQDWLGWNEESRKFARPANLKKLLSWTLKPDTGEDIKIVRAVDVRDVLSELVLNPTLLARFENGSINIDQARVELANQSTKAAPNVPGLKEQLLQTRTFIDTLPLPAIDREGSAADFSKLLSALKESVEAQLKFLTKT